MKLQQTHHSWQQTSGIIYEILIQHGKTENKRIEKRKLLRKYNEITAAYTENGRQQD